MTHSTEMTIAELEAEILKAEAWKVEGLTSEDKRFMRKQMAKHKKLLEDKKKAAGVK